MERILIKESETISEAIIKIYGYYNGRTKKFFDELVIKNGINISHLKKRKVKYNVGVKKCPVCEKLFKTKVGHKDEKTTCSHACSNTHFRSGTSNPNWKETNENTKYRRICFENHKKECIICGENKIVAVHHYDENKTNNNPENLIPLCPTHHCYFHSKYKDDVIEVINTYRNNFLLKTSSD
jgi:hypothetical protein